MGTCQRQYVVSLMANSGDYAVERVQHGKVNVVFLQTVHNWYASGKHVEMRQIFFKYSNIFILC